MLPPPDLGRSDLLRCPPKMTKRLDLVAFRTLLMIPLLVASVATSVGASVLTEMEKPGKKVVRLPLQPRSS